MNKRVLGTIGTLLLWMLPLDGIALPEILRVGLFYEEKVEAVDLYVHEGRYKVTLDDEALDSLKVDEGVKVEYLDSGELRVTDPFGKSKKGRKLRLEQISGRGSFKLRKGAPYPVDRLYPEELIIKAREKDLQCINRVGLQEYLEGVVLAEAGMGHHPEFYKVQAVVCRTYALHNLKKFEEEGIHLCDKVACQVYRGMNTEEPRIDSAVAATEGIVLVDEDIDLITAAYHSNSGGRTAASEDAWSKALPYLRPIDDPFSQEGKHYEWKKTIPRSEWLDYLQKEFSYPVKKKRYRKKVVKYENEGREVHLLAKKDSIPLKKVRRDLGLNSTYFQIREKKDSVIFEGKGFGHGVGLSQEGAMEMADLGIPYEEILQFYYQGVHLVKTEALDFFRDEERRRERP